MADRLIAILISVCVAVTCGDDPLCNNNLIKTLPDSHLSSSSNRVAAGLYTGPERGRLNTTEVKAANGTTLEGAWSPAADSQSEYIQAMFDDVTMITNVMTQGRNQSNEFVGLYTIQYTEDGQTWQTVSDDIGIEQIFQGNSDSDTIQDTPLNCPIFAKGIRIVPREWHNHVALRFDVKGCSLDNSAPVIPTPGSVLLTIPAKSTTINMLTLIQWFKTALSNVSAITTPLTTTAVKTTTPFVFHPGIPSHLLPVGGTPVTTIPPFMPGIQHPFGTTRAFYPGIGLVG